MKTWIALLRGINVGGKHKLPMAELRALLAEQGCDNARTLIQSGNAVFQSDCRAEQLSEDLSAAIQKRFGYSVPVIVRSVSAFAAVLERHPQASPDTDIKHLSVGFLSAAPDPERVAALDPERSPGDRFTVLGSEIYLHFPNGSARSKLTTAWFDRHLGRTLTVRNWRTVNRVFDLASS